MATPFRTSEAAERGFGRGALRGRGVRRTLRGVYVEAWTQDGLAERVAAAGRVLPADARAEGVTVLRLLGLDLGTDEPLRFVTAHPHQVRRPGLRVRRSCPGTVAAASLPESVFLAAACDLDLVDLVSAGDWLVRQGLTSPERLVRCSALASGRGSRHARRAAALVRARVDSVQETRLRLCLVLAGLPEPEVNPTVHVRGRRVGRVDLLLRRWAVVVEYEGDQHRTDRRQWNRDVWRHERLAEDDHVLVRVTAERMASPRAVVLEVHRALVGRGYDGSEPLFNAEWRTLFATAR